MHPFVLPEQSKARVGATSAPVAEIADVHDLIPGVDDIPYIRAHFGMTGVIHRREQDVKARGLKDVYEEKASLHEACCTFWDPTDDERMVIAAGGYIQVLNFTKEQPIMSMGVMWLSPPEYPKNDAVIVAVAKALYEDDRPNIPWSQLTPAEVTKWKGLARKANQIIGYWRDKK